ncbi:hypothetical protein Bca101_072442 [Brassica carinata]
MDKWIWATGRGLIQFRALPARDKFYYLDSFLDVIRPGEWGDHVTLQTAADRVS